MRGSINMQDHWKAAKKLSSMLILQMTLLMVHSNFLCFTDTMANLCMTSSSFMTESPDKLFFPRSEERRVGKECRSRGSRERCRHKKKEYTWIQPDITR